MLPAFHGEKMQRLSGLDGGGRRARGGALAEGRADRAASAPPGADARDHPARRLRPRRGRAARRAARPAHRDPRVRRAARLDAADAPARPRRGASSSGARDEADALIYETIDERRAERRRRHERDDVLAMLLDARHEDGSPMSPVELRDELMTLLVAGHETTASELAWAFERLTRTPDVLARLDRRDRLGRRRRVRHGDRARDAPPPAGAAERRAAAGDGAGRGRRLALRAGRVPDRRRVPAAPRPGRSTPTRTPSGPSASSTSSPAPTPGSRSAAAAAAAWARASRCSR